MSVPDGRAAREWAVVGWPRRRALEFLRQARDEIARHGGTASLPFGEGEIRDLDDLIAALTD